MQATFYGGMVRRKRPSCGHCGIGWQCRHLMALVPAPTDDTPVFQSTLDQLQEKTKEKMPAHKTKGIHAPLEVSPALGKIIGTQKGERLTRGEVVKKLYAYVKEKKLQDEEFKMYFKPDATMKPVFGEEEQRMCWMLKHLKGHLTIPKK